MNAKCGLVKINNEDNECFRWCHVRHLPNLIGDEIENTNKVTKVDRTTTQFLDYSGIYFPVQIRDIPRIENAFGYSFEGDQPSKTRQRRPDNEGHKLQPEKDTQLDCPLNK